MVRICFSLAWLFTRIVAEKPINCYQARYVCRRSFAKRLRMTDLESFIGSTADDRSESFVGSTDQMNYASVRIPRENRVSE
jgi:hypothetical protein